MYIYEHAYDRAVVALREVLGADAVANLMAEGATMTEEQAVEEASGGRRPRTPRVNSNSWPGRVRTAKLLPSESSLGSRGFKGDDDAQLHAPPRSDSGLALPGDTRRATLLGVALISSW